jgi:hypothetical protein
MYRHGKLAGAVAELRALQTKGTAELPNLEAKGKTFFEKLRAGFTKEQPKLEGAARDVFAEVLKEVQSIRADVTDLKQKQGGLSKPQ